MTRTLLRLGLIVAVLLLGPATAVRAGQLGSLVAPGPLSKAHAALEGVTNCVKCHDAGRQESAAKCLGCHKPIADRIARKTGVHRAVTNECARCHAEHGGADAEVRRIDVRTFDHAGETGFALEGRHGAVSAKCAACHPKRSFLEARPACGSCHEDTHKNKLGPDCARCHLLSGTFKDARTQFDHRRTEFMLVGAHRTVACEKCHAGGLFRELQHDTCTPCHQDTHRRKFGTACTTCHNQLEWATRLVDHRKTGFTLAGAHVRLDCAKCHQTGSMTKPLRSDQCSACHSNLHRASVREDCRACHTETNWRGATFDHRARTAFPLDGKHDGLVCRKCHTSITPDSVPLARKVVDFGGAKTECAACHADPHKGDLGRTCDVCHRSATFKTAGFAHARTTDFFAGRHTGVTCANCHLRPGLQPSHAATAAVAGPPKPPSMTCNSCHADVHLGQVGAACERCHTIGAEKFAASRFSHQQVAFQLTGKHQTVACAKCHPSETRVFPSGRGTATRLTPTPTQCASCHQDPHMGQVTTECGACHSAATFTLSAYTHTGLGNLFAPLHSRLACQSCHKSETGLFPKGKGTAIRFKVGRTCSTCHSQV